MPAPRHLRHPAPHPSHRHTTRIPSPLLPSIRYPIATLQQLAILDRYIRTSPHPTSSPSYSTSIYAPRPDLLPHVLTLPSAALSTLPYSVPPLFRTHSPHPQHLTAILLHSSPPLFRRKVCTPPPKASSNPPVEIFCSKRGRRLILNILPRRHHVDNSVSSSVHSEEKA